MPKVSVILTIVLGVITGLFIFNFTLRNTTPPQPKDIQIVKADDHIRTDYFLTVDQDTVYQLTGGDSYHINDRFSYRGKHILFISQISMGTGVFASSYVFITVHRNNKITESRNIPHPSLAEITLDENRHVIILEFEGNEDELPEHIDDAIFTKWQYIPTVTFEYNLKNDKLKLIKGEDNWWM